MEVHWPPTYPTIRSLARSLARLVFQNPERIEAAQLGFASTSIFMQMITEAFAIVISGIIYIVFERQRMVFNFGYPGEKWGGRRRQTVPCPTSLY